MLNLSMEANNCDIWLNKLPQPFTFSSFSKKKSETLL